MPPLPWASTHLDRRPATIEQVLDDSLGIYGTRPTGHLELAARLDRYRPADLDRVLLADRRAARLRTLRGSGFLIPTALLPVTQGATRSRNARAFAGLIARRLVEDYETWADRIDDLAAGGAQSVAQIREAFATAADAGLLRYVVSQMATENRLVAVPQPGGWRADRVVFHRWADWLPGVDVWSLPEGEARRRLAAAYLDRHGPATVEDFSWWSGLTKTQARQAVAVVAEPVDGEYWATTPPSEDDPPYIRLLPIWDALFVTYRDRSRFVSPAHYPLVYDSSGNATSVVLRNGRAAGQWDLGPDDERLEIRVAPFGTFTPSEWHAVEAEAERVGTLAGSATVDVIRIAEPVDLTMASRNRFMRPLRPE